MSGPHWGVVLAMSRDIFSVHNWGHAVTTGREAQDAGKCPAMHRTALQQRISRPPNTSSAEAR